MYHWRINFRGSELSQLLLAWLVLGFCFSINALSTPSLFPIRFFSSLITLGLGFIVHELAHRYVARMYGCWAEFRVWPFGLALAVIFALASGGRMIFAAPGAVYIVPMAYPLRLNRKAGGLISLVGPLAQLLVTILFYPLASIGGVIGLIGSMGWRINLWQVAFNVLPYGMLDGRKILNWSRMVWAAITIPTWILLFLSQVY